MIYGCSTRTHASIGYLLAWWRASGARRRYRARFDVAVECAR